MSRIILGLDPGIADTGYGVIRDNGSSIECLTYGSIQTSPKLSLANRLEELFNSLNDIIKEYKPDYVAVEELFFNKNVKTALIVGQARGVIILSIKINNLDLKEFTPPQVKQAVTSYGRATKNQVQKMVKMILKLKEIPKPDDAADALAVAICALNNNQFLCREN
ncbi:MAG: crossover junction endodeoxyribonuclease RuvC [Patescibacteria group bacterium]|jgi:crossover junction endodeoxyribonuclease RuvC|nr:crossover junction endodeoxyribonuclease RuvC [Patescibacteria group bacterium]